MKKPRTNSIHTKLLRSRLNWALQQALRPSSLISAGILTFSLATHPLAAQTLELSDLDGNNGFVINGVAIGDRSGTAVSGLGDFNGDGIDDLLIGAYLADPNGDSSGASYVVFGRSSGSPPISSLDLATLDGSNGFVINGVAADDQAGGAVSGLGDVNDDGIDDLLIGASLADPNGGGSGASYVVFGRSSGSPPISELDLATLDGSNGFVINGVAASDDSGHAVSGLGDVNDDGIDDLLIGASLADPNTDASGASYVVFGRPNGSPPISSLDLATLNGSNGFVINGVGTLHQSGYSVSDLGDINGDGIADLLIGAPFAGPDFGTGASYVVFGRPSGSPSISALELSTLNGDNGFVINGVAGGDVSLSGFAVSGLGDVNDDSIDDLLIGAVGTSGASYVVFGRSSGSPPISSLELSALNGSNGFAINSGVAVSGLGDVNGDDIDDFLIGASGADPNGSDSGASYVVFGRSSGSPAISSLDLATLDGNNGFVINGVAADDNSGRAVSGLGDVNSDGADDFLIGASGAAPNGLDSGASYVVFGIDPTPDAFSFDPLTNVASASPQTSAAITVTGISTAVPIVVSGGVYSVDGDPFPSNQTTVSNGQIVRVRHNSSANFLASVNTILTIGGVSATFTTTTAAEDITVDAFTFTDLTNIAPATAQTSNAITVTGINNTVPISVSSGLYSIDGGAFTASSGTISNGQTVRVRHTSSANFSASVNTTLTIGNASDTFTSRTLAEAAQADLSLSLAAVPASVLLNDTIEYVHTVTNQSGNSTGGVQLTFEFPDSLSLSNDISADAWECTGVTETTTCTLGTTLVPLASSELRLRFIVLRPRLINTTTSVSSASPDLNLANNQASASTRAFATTANVLINPNSDLLTTELDALTAEVETGFIVVLTRQPLDGTNVTLSLSSSDTTEGTIGRVVGELCDADDNNDLELTFNTTDWNENRNLCVTGINDDISDGNIPYTITTSPLVSDDPDYDSFDPTDVFLINIDRTQSPDIFVSSISRPTSEDGTDAVFNVTLTAEPTADVNIDISSDNPNEGIVDKSLLVFTPANWFQPQTVTVIGQDDDDADGNVEYFIITDTAVSADTDYHGRNPANLRVINLDNEPSVVIFEDEFEE